MIRKMIHAIKERIHKKEQKALVDEMMDNAGVPYYLRNLSMTKEDQDGLDEIVKAAADVIEKAKASK